MSVEFYPKETNLGKPCQFWQLGLAACEFPKFELQGRTTCGGVIDDVCLYVKDGRTPSSRTTTMLLKGINTSMPNSSLLPPGETS